MVVQLYLLLCKIIVADGIYTSNFIADQTIIKGQYSNFNWATKINGEYSSIIGTILKFEAQDCVMYNTIGNYSVRVGIEDAGGRKRYQYIVVSVIYGGC